MKSISEGKQREEYKNNNVDNHSEQQHQSSSSLSTPSGEDILGALSTNKTLYRKGSMIGTLPKEATSNERKDRRRSTRMILDRVRDQSLIAERQHRNSIWKQKKVERKKSEAMLKLQQVRLYF